MNEPGYLFAQVLIAAALLCVRFKREPKWAGFARFIVATLIVWVALMGWESTERMQRMRERAVAGDLHAYDFDTGGGAAMILLGWIPSVLFVGLVMATRSFLFWLIRRRSPPHSGSITDRTDLGSAGAKPE